MILLLGLPVLLVGAGLSVAIRSNRASAAVSLASQAIATGLVISGVLPLLRAGPAQEFMWAWPRPIETIVFRLDGLGAFFLAWSLPMTLLGTVYAVGYLRPYFERGRHGG